ncbi:MAG: HNH endonuclease [Ardenticatenaceae bacterium]
MNPNYPLIAVRAGHRCEYCRAPEIIFNTSFEVDHIKPIAKGGTNDPINYALACRICNGHKSAALGAIDPLSQQLVSLFNPRQQAWEDHFEVQDKSPFKIVGKTPTGRASVERLQFNAPRQLTARALWIKLALFP